jgi:hypothetical protein
MRVTHDQVRAMLELQGLRIPEDEIEDVTIRLSTWLSAFMEVEAELGELMDRVDPVPPVYPREEF